jgi:hypothetical protein
LKKVVDSKKAPSTPVVVAARGAELLFQVLTEREERSAIAFDSNEPFNLRGQTFTDRASARQLSTG